MAAWEPLPDELQPLSHFCTYILRELRLADTPTKQQLGILHYLENGPDRQIITAYRGCGKSTLTGIYALWRLRMDPFREKVLLVGATADKAVEISNWMLRLVKDIDILQCLEPADDGRGSVNGWDVGPAIVDQSPSVRAVGILSPSLTGKRCSCAIADDIETLSNSITPLKQERLAAAITELEAIRKPEVEGELPKQTIFLGTPHLESSLYLRLNRERNYQMRFWPARYPDPTPEFDPYSGNLDPHIAAEVEMNPALEGDPTDPERFGHDELLRREASMTRSSVQLQFMLNCQLSTLDRYPIRLGDLIVCDLDGKALPEVITWASGPDQRIADLVCVGMGADRFYHRPMITSGWIPQSEHWQCVLAIDPSGRGQDEMAWAVVACMNGNYFVLESGGTTQGYSEETLKVLAMRAKRWNVTQVVIEANFGDGMFSQILQPVLNRVYPAGIEEVRVNIQKERRIIDVLAPVIQQHRMVISTEVIRKDYREAERDPEKGHIRSLLFQASRITVERGSLMADDRIDALALAVQFFIDNAAQDQERMAQQRKDELMDWEIEAFMDLTGESIDALVMGVRPDFSRKAYGGVTRRPVDVQ
ncbi:terminase large subunit [uncultured phage_MedDCM-OCT-S38-C3]|uniref:Terminase large subunit n=1 Tax=uncultured phage_MedDCM-OCT-S38-C3 TaxID=2740803 RepID=A0A6S4PIU1_9CAUD|nr:terminase large subunit [uncultured phage_MedDCM-OCT-S38-C3]BAQ94426.1 terminase large subunit [uncultured phage_MedDCM-OCT-S38-C3]